MKKAGAFIFAAALMIALCLGAAADVTDEAKSVADKAGATGISDPNVEPGELTGEKNVNIFEKAIGIIGDALSGNGVAFTAKFGLLLAAVIFAAVMNSLKFGSDELDRATGYITLLIVSAAAYAVVSDLYTLTSAALKALSAAVTALSPVAASLYIMGGNPAAAAAAGSGTALFLTVAELISANVILPLFGAVYAISLAGAMPGSADITPLASTVRTVAVTVFSFVFSLVGFTIYTQTAIGAAADGYAARSVKFASGVAVPVIGNMVGDAYRTVAAAVSVVKASVGTAGIVMVLAAVLPPVVIAGVYRIFMAICSAAAKSLGCENESRLLQGLSAATGLVFALTVGSGAVCVISMAVLI